jgi:hypothetical protein
MDKNYEATVSSSNFIPILEQNANNQTSLTNFKTKVTLHASVNHKKLSLIFNDLKYHVFDLPTVPRDYDENNQADVGLFKHTVKKFFDEKSKYEDDKLVLFAVMKSRISEASWSKILAEPHIFPPECLCPLKLWQTIIYTHVFQRIGIPIVDTIQMKKNVLNLNMNDDENIHEYLNRFKEQLTYATEMGIVIVEEEKAAIFINNLNTNYNEFKSKLFNESIQKTVVFPSTLQDIFTKASLFIPSTNTHSTSKKTKETVLITQALTEMKKKSAEKDKAKNIAKSKETGEKKKEEPRSTFNDGTVAPTRQCKWCKNTKTLSDEEKLHYDSNCPRIALIQQLIDKGDTAVKSALNATTYTHDYIANNNTAYNQETLDP